MNQPSIQEIENRLKVLETLIEDTKKRLPAHSVKPPVMMELLDYEDEYQALLEQLNAIKNG